MSCIRTQVESRCRAMSLIEIIGFVSGAWSVWSYVRQQVWAWPVGLVNSAAWLVLFWQSRLFLDAGIQVLYLVLGVWGWFSWWRGTPEGRPLPVTRASRRQVVASPPWPCRRRSSCGGP